MFQENKILNSYQHNVMCDRSAHCVEAGGQGDITEGARGEDEGEEEEEKTSVIKATETGHQ